MNRKTSTVIMQDSGGERESSAGKKDRGKTDTSVGGTEGESCINEDEEKPIRNEKFDMVMSGKLNSLPALSSKIVRIFTSSTFTDTTIERNALMEQVYPKIKEYCREKHGLEFQVVDMRWGVRDEATDDHMTTELCMQEIENCQRLSMGPNFVVFLGQKYGYRPIPTKIVSNEFDLVRECIKNVPVDQALLETWYKKDDNSVPPVYILQPISSILVNFNNKRHPKLQEQDQNTWWETMLRLQKMLRKAAQVLFIARKLNREQMHNFFMSVTEREILRGLLKASNTADHCLAYIRNISNMNTAFLFANKFLDFAQRSVDNEAQKLLTSLRDDKIPKALCAENIKRSVVQWSGNTGITRETHSPYIDEFSEHFFNNMIRLVDKAMSNNELLAQDKLYSDILQHLHACATFCKVFQGREDLVDRIRDYVKGESRYPLILNGESGCGKTSLMAKGASKVIEWLAGENITPLLMMRFLGTSPDSSSIIPLLYSLCFQLCHNYEQSVKDIPDELALLSQHFKKLLACANKHKPIVLFLDSLDQLSGADGAHRLAWLPTQLPPHVRVVVSTLPNYYGLLETLKKMIVSEENYIKVTPLGQNLSSTILQSWMKNANKAITTDQWKIVHDAFTKCNLPLFVKLVFDEICRWKSYSKPSNTTLASSIHESITKLFDRIEQQHGKTLVSHALGYITASKSGLSEAELEDLLSLDEKVLNDVYQYHLPPVRRIPPLLWTRIRNDLPGYLSEREADGVPVIDWYHRQFIDAARERYFRNLNFVSWIHSTLADYFLGTWGGISKPYEYSELQRQRFHLSDTKGESDRKVPVQPMAFCDSSGKILRYNLRKLSELPFHLIRSHRYDDLYSEVLFNYNFLQAKLSSMPLQATLADFEDSLDHIFDKDTKLLSDTLRLSASILSHYPEMLGPQITGRLLPYYSTHEKIRQLIDQCDTEGLKDCALVPSYHCLHTPGGPLQYSLEGHPFAPFGIRTTSDARYLVSVSNKFIIWDLSTGEVFRTVSPGVEGIMQNLSLSPDDKYGVTYTNNNQVIICSIMTGEYRVIPKPVEGNGVIMGTSANNTHLVVWSTTHWHIYSLDGELETKQKIANHTPLIQLDLCTSGENYMILKSGEDNDNDMTLAVENGNIESFEFHSAIAITNDKNAVYACIGISENDVAVYKKDGPRWALDRSFDNADPVFALTLSPDDSHLVATLPTGYKLWKLSTNKLIELKLPAAIRNIPTRNNFTGMVLFTRSNHFVVAGVRKNLYVYDSKSGNLVKTLDAHFGRIIAMTSVTNKGMNKIISSSIDKTIKVWNFDNIYEQVHSIDRHDKPIDSISLASNAYLGITTTRNCVGVWSLETGRLLKQLSNSSHSSIVSHAVIVNNGHYVVSAESGHTLIWDICEDSKPAKVLRIDACKDTQQLMLNEEDTKFIAISKNAVNKARAICRAIPSGDLVYEFDYNFKRFRKGVLTSDGLFLILPGAGKSTENLGLYHAKTGTHMYNINPKYPNWQEFISLVAMPHEPNQIALIDPDKGTIYDVKKKSVVRSVQKWNGKCTQTGKLGLYAPSRGGLELLELKTGKVVHTLIPKIAEGVFAVKVMFTKDDRYVIYYHTGHRTIRIFRVQGGSRVAHFKCHAEINALIGSQGGSHLLLGAVDGSLTMLTITDPQDESAVEMVRSLPSRHLESPQNTPIHKNNGGVRNGGSAAQVLGATVQVTRFVAKAKQAQKSRACVLQ